MNVGLWNIQVLLALVFLMHGRLMLSPPASIQPGMAYVSAIPTRFRQSIGVAEILGAIGLAFRLLRLLP